MPAWNLPQSIRNERPFLIVWRGMHHFPHKNFLPLNRTEVHYYVIVHKAETAMSGHDNWLPFTTTRSSLTIITKYIN